MKVTLKSLTFDNMFSYGKNNVIQLNDNKITQLIATNGSGKTNIALIIQELLFSKNVKGTKKTDILNRHANEKTWTGTLYFDVDQDEYEITVTRLSASSKVKLIKNGKDITEHKVVDTYKKLSNILGVDFSVFSQLTYQSSTDALDFLKATDTNRKKFLINLFNLGKYIEIGENIKKLSTEIDGELLQNKGELKSVNDFISSVEIKDPKTLLKVPDVSEILPQEIATLKNELENYQNLCKRIDKNNLLIEERNNLKFDVSLEFFEPDKSFFDGLITARNNVSTWKNNIVEINKNLKSIDVADSCYACGQPLNNTHSLELKDKLEKDIEKAKEQLENEKNNLQIIEKQHDKYLQDKTIFEKNKSNIEKFEQLCQLIDTDLQKNYPDYENIQTTLQSKVKELKKQTQERNDVQKQNENINIFNTKIEALIDQKRQFLVRQQLLENDKIKLSSKSKNLTILKKAFSTSGIVAFKLENLTKDLEDNINLYLSELSDGQFQVEFRLTKEKLNIVVIDQGKESPIETVSGGEFGRIQTAILLSIKNTLSKLGNSNINLLFLDEIMGVLDMSGKEKLIEILQNEEDLNVFLITHDYTHPLISKINIEKNNKISKICD